MTPSGMTIGQVEKAVAGYRAMLVKHASDFQSEAAQSVLGSSDFTKEQFKLFRDRVEAQSTIITRTAPVDRTRTPKEAMLATGRIPYLDDVVVADMPLGVGDTVTMSFYRFGRRIACNKLNEELAKVGFELVVDPMGQAAVNEADSEFADEHPNGTQWKTADGKYCYAVFDRWSDERRVYVGQSDDGWYDGWWFPVRSK